MYIYLNLNCIRIGMDYTIFATAVCKGNCFAITVQDVNTYIVLT